MKPNQSRFQTVHQLDSIYYGQLNNSYQKDGFGVLQTFEFDMYLGYWRNNKTEGLGLVILSTGTIIYANFNRDTVDGLTIIDDGNLLVCGIYRNHMIVGVGFQYNHSLKLWKMNRYHKGVSIQTIKEEYQDIAVGLPKIINVQQSIYFHLYSYIYKNYFQDLEYTIITEISKEVYYFGINDSKNLYGPGVCIFEYDMTEAGFYQDGLLHGFGFKCERKPFSYQFGCYHRGRKDGPFLERDEQKSLYQQYRKGILIKNLPNSEAILRKAQRTYNFNCKDFFSAKNNLPFDEFRRGYKTKQIKEYQSKKVDFISKTKLLSPEKSPKKLSPLKQDNRQSKTSSNQNYIIGEQKQKSSLQIIREKMGQYFGIVSGRRKGNDSSPKKPVLKSIQGNSEDFDDEIAKQQSPFQ